MTYSGLTEAKAFRLVSNQADGCFDIETTELNFSPVFTGTEMIADANTAVTCDVVVEHSPTDIITLPDVTYQNS